MLSKCLRNTFSGSLFSWGNNLMGRGTELSADIFATLPIKIALSNNLAARKATSGFGQGIFVTENGELQLCGSKNIWTDMWLKPETPNSLAVFKGEVKVKDADLDQSHILVLTEDGVVYQSISKTQMSIVELPGSSRLIAAGNNVSFAVVKIDKEEKLFGWGVTNFENSSVFCQHYPEQKSPSEVFVINQLLKKTGESIKKIAVVDDSVVLLTDKGTLLTWGNNTSACLGVPRSELSLIENYVYEPSNPLKLANINDSVIDFALSQNILVVQGKNGVYWCGLENRFSLRSVSLPDNGKIDKVGASHNHFYLIDSNGKIFTNQPIPGEKDLKFYGKENLYEIDQRYFGCSKIKSIEGKYHNVFAISN